MANIQFIVIGITDETRPELSSEVAKTISASTVFSGGKRHHELMDSYLPASAQWIDITIPLTNVFEVYRKHFTASPDTPIVVFASGDPLFFGFAVTLQREFPDAQIRLFPSFNSLQTLAHRLVLPYHDMHIVSLTGRDWHEFDRALIERTPKIGVLTDRTHTPNSIARRMIEYGFNGYRMYVGEHLGSSSNEKIMKLSLQEASAMTFSHPNCMILHAPNGLPARRFGIADNEFELLDGRTKMITKSSIRLLSLQALDLYGKKVMWDIGFCTGSISIEARLQFPHLHIEAFEIREEGQRLFDVNTRRFGTPGIGCHIGDFIDADIDGLLVPDAVFIGGHGGKLIEIVGKVLTVMQEGGTIVMNSVTEKSHELFCEACRLYNLRQDDTVRVTINDYHTIEIMKATVAKK